MLPCGVFNNSYKKDMAIIRTVPQWALTVGALGLLFALPQYLSRDWLAFLVMLCITAIAVLGLHVLTGLCGQYSIGQAAFVAVGAYTTAILTTKYGFSPWASLPLSGIIAGLSGIAFGIPALRIKGFYLVMSTIAAQFIIVWVLRELDWTGGPYGIGVSPIEIGGKTLGYTGFAWLALALTVVMLLLAKNIQRTATGRKFVAVRDNDLAAEVSGINLFRTKLTAFFIGCFFAGIAGWLWAHFFLRITPLQFSFDQSLWYLGMLVVGGVGSTTGAVLGVVSIRLVEKLVDDQLSPVLVDAFPSMAHQIAPALVVLVFAMILLTFILYEPRGLYHWIQRVKAYYRVHPYAE